MKLWFTLRVVLTTLVLSGFVTAIAWGAPAPVAIAPGNLNFGNQVAGTTSAIKTLTVTNNQTVSLSIFNIVTAGPFSQTNNCGAFLAAKSSCTVNVSFSPGGTGAFTGSVTVTDDASTSPQTAGLTGTGVAPVTLSTSSVNFGNQIVGTMSAPKAVTLTNLLNTPLTIFNIAASGDFQQTNNCGAAVAAGGSCTINVTFVPTAAGTRTGVMTISDNAATSPQTAPLSGNGTLNGLSSIAVTPANPSVPLGLTQQFHATATFNNGSTSDITGAVTWSSSAPGVAAIAAGGLASSVSQGGTTITATSGSITGSTTLTVAPPALVSLAVTPAHPSIRQGTTQQFTATGTYTDSSTQDLTASASWSSSAPGIATVSQGLASGIGQGFATITATSGSVAGSASLAVTSPYVPRFAYISGGAASTGGNAITGTAIDPATGNLTTVSGSPFPSILTQPHMAAAPSGNFLYVGEGNGLEAYTIDSNIGALTPVNGSPFTASGLQLVQIAVHPSGAFLYGANGSTGVPAFTLDPVTGAAAPMAGSPFTAGPNAWAAAVDPAGKFLFVANANFAGAAGTISVFSIDPASGVPAPISNSPFAAGTRPAALAVDPSGRFLYVANQSADNSPGSISAYRIDGAGNLTPIAGPVPAGTMPQGVTVDPSGRFVYVANQVTNDISAYSIDPGSGALTPLPNSPYATGLTNVFSVLVDPSGKFVYAPGATSFNVASFSLDFGTGALTPLPTPMIGVEGAWAMAMVGTIPAPPPALTSLQVIPPNPSIAAGTKQQFTALGTFSDGTTRFLTASVTWSSNSPIASVSNSPGTWGLATSHAQGSAIITATLGGVSGSTTLNVGPPAVYLINVNPCCTSVPAGLTQPFTATAYFTDGSSQDVTYSAAWSSSNPMAATVNSSGVATGILQSNFVTISATVGSVSGTATLYVTAPVAVSTFVTPANPSIAQGGTQQFAVKTLYSDGSSQSCTSCVTWTSSAPGVAGINSAGLATGIAAGMTTITANSTPQSGGTFSVFTTLTVTGSTGGGGGTAARFAYVTNFGSNTVSAYTVTSAGALGASGSYPSGINPDAGIAVDPAGKFLYVTNYGDGTISAYSIAVDGSLSPVAACGGCNLGPNTYPFSVKVHPLGGYAYVSVPGAGVIAVFSIGSTGALTLSQAPSTTGPVGLISLDPQGKYLYGASGGQNANLSQFSIDQVNGTLTALPSTMTPAAGVNDVVAHPSGNFVFVAGSANPSTSPGSVTAYSVDPATGALTFKSAQPTGQFPDSIDVDPSGKFVYTSNAFTGDISAFSFDSTSGALTPVPGSPFTTGSSSSSPQTVKVDPTGSFLYVVVSSGVEVFGINTSTGALSPAAFTGAGTNPIGIVLTPGPSN